MEESPQEGRNRLIGIARKLPLEVAGAVACPAEQLASPSAATTDSHSFMSVSSPPIRGLEDPSATRRRDLVSTVCSQR